jgi:hypothetical protein
LLLEHIIAVVTVGVIVGVQSREGVVNQCGQQGMPDTSGSDGPLTVAYVETA